MRMNWNEINSSIIGRDHVKLIKLISLPDRLDVHKVFLVPLPPLSSSSYTRGLSSGDLLVDLRFESAILGGDLLLVALLQLFLPPLVILMLVVQLFIRVYTVLPHVQAHLRWHLVYLRLYIIIRQYFYYLRRMLSFSLRIRISTSLNLGIICF